MKLVLKPDVYPLKFIIWGENRDFSGLFEELEKAGVSPKEITEALEPMVEDMNNTAGFRLDFGSTQAVWVGARLKWATLDTYMHELLHAVWSGLEYIGVEDEEAHCYLMDYLVREVSYCKGGK